MWRGEAFGFLGPNGAGKSSTMRMIGAVSPPVRRHAADPRAGSGHRRSAIRARLGVCPQDDTLDTELSVRENLTIYGRYFGLSRAECARSRADELLEFVALTEKADVKVDELSGGMKRRLTIARSLVNKPDLLLLDEPTTGPRPAGPAPVVGQAVPAQAAGRDARADHALHGRGRAAVRPAGRDGRRPDRRAEGSPAALIRDYSTREVTELRFADDVIVRPRRAVTDRVADLAAADRGPARPAAALHRRRRGGRRGACTRGGLQPATVFWFGARPWRTCSSGSPAGAWSTR